MSNDYAALLKSAKDIPVLSTGINGTVTRESTYPTKEHPSLLTHTGKTVNTPLNSTLSARYIKIPNNPKDPHYADRHTLASIRKNALTLSFRGHRNGKVPRIEWDQYYLHLLPMVIEHPKVMLVESKEMSDTLRKIYKASSDFIGDASLSAEQQVALKTRSLCLPLLADNPWEPPDDEEDTISEIVLEDRGLDAIPVDGSEERTKYDNTVVQYSRAMSFLREILNHTFLRAVYYTSSRQAKLEYQEVQRNFINDHSNDDPDDEPVKFTALNIIRYIETECLCTNEKALQSIQNTISKMVRYNNQSMLDWLQSFVAPVNKLLKATAQQVLGQDDAKMIWKDHFVNQITLSEKSIMLLFQVQHLTVQEMDEIKRLPDGEFNEKTLQKLVTKLSSNFEPYKPDKAILQYLNQHSRQLGLDSPSFTNPKDKNNNSDKSEKHKPSSSGKKNYRTDSSNRKRKRSDASDFKSKYNDSKSKSRESSHDRRDKGEIPIGEQCRRINCKQRGSYTNHRHKDCRYKNGDKTSPKHPNLGRAPTKSKDIKSKRESSSQVQPFAAATVTNDRRCYICNDPNHLSNACPQKDKNKQHAHSKLKANRSFMALFKASFPKPEDKACAQRMIDAWDEDHICPSCIKPCLFAHECNPNDIVVTQRVQSTISNNQLLHYLEEAHNPHITHLQASNPVTFGTSFFLPTGGHSVSSARDPSPIHQYQDDTDSSRSDSRSICENNSQSDNSSEDSDNEADKRSDDQGSSHRGSDSS
jgi:hypothetical protein